MGFCTCSTAGRILSAEKKYERTTARRIRRRFNTKEKRKRDNTKESESEREHHEKRERDKERIIKNVSQKEKEKKKKLHVLRARVALYQQREKHTKKERVICNNTLQK